MDLGSSIRRRRRSPRSVEERGSEATAAEAGKTKAKDSKAKDSKAKRRRKAGRPAPRSRVRRLDMALLVATTGAGAGYLTATRALFPLPDLPTDLQEVPELRGAELRSALAVLADSGLIVERIDSLRHPTIPAGVVVGQSPLPGPTALPGAAVRVAVSVGPELRLVPNVRRWHEDRASALMTESGFDVQVDTVESALPAGQVVGTEPAADAQVPVPSTVLVMVSLGPPTFPLPDLEGRIEVEARRRLRLLGLRVAEVERRFSLRNVAAVFGQSPNPGDPVQRGDSVRLVVGKELPRNAGAAPSAPPSPDSGTATHRDEDAGVR